MMLNYNKKATNNHKKRVWWAPLRLWAGLPPATLWPKGSG